MKVLLLTNKPFLPTIDGGTSATKAFINQLIDEEFEISYLTFSSEKHPFDKALFEQKEWKQIRAKNVPIVLKINPVEAIKALVKRISYQLTRFENFEMVKLFQEITNKENFDYIVLDSLYSAQMIEKLKKSAPNSIFILRTHNVESKLTVEKAKNQSNPLNKLYLSILAKQLEKREKEIIKQFDKVLSISEDDTNLFLSWGNKNIITLPFFPEKTNYSWQDSPDSFMHFGAMNWQPNIESYSHLAKEIFPEINRSCPTTQLKVAGSFMGNIPPSDNTAIHIVGFVENKFEFLANNGILLAPVKSGSGVRVKIIEALSIGVPVVTTEIGAQGIPVQNNFGLIVCKSDTEFIQKSIELARSQEKREELSKQALEFYTDWHSNFSLKTIFASHDRK